MTVSFSPLLNQLINALQCLPGVGPKSAQRIAFHLLERNREGGKQLASVLTQSLTHIDRCIACRTFSEHTYCQLCQQKNRDTHQLCIVENPVDMLAIEQTTVFRGYYFVLMGYLSPVDGIGPEELGLDQLLQRIQNDDIREIILATNPTVEGEATAYYIANLVKPYQVKTTRIAHGVPLGGELEFIDSGTIAKALCNRELL